MPTESFETLAEGLSNFHETSHSTFLLEHLLFPSSSRTISFFSLSSFSRTRIKARKENARISRDTPAHPRPVDHGRPSAAPSPNTHPPRIIIFVSVILRLFLGGEEKGGNSFPRREQESKRFICLFVACFFSFPLFLSLLFSQCLPAFFFPRHFGTTAHSSSSGARAVITGAEHRRAEL